MRNGILGTLMVLLVGASFVAAQSGDALPAPAAPVRGVGTPAPGTASPPASVPAPSPSQGPGAPDGSAASPVEPGAPACPEPCGPTDRFWVSADYLYWWFKKNLLPPLVTTRSAADIASGAQGLPATEILFGGAVEPEGRSGVRLSGGWWLTDDHSLGFEAGWLLLAQRSTSFSIASTGTIVLARPFTSEPADTEDVAYVALPGVQNGAIAAAFTSRLDGAEANLDSEVLHGKGWRITVLGGFRYLELSEAVSVNESTATLTSSPGFAEPNLASSDFFGTRNYFYGGQIGGRGEFTSGRVSFDALVKLAFGLNHEIVNIQGSTTVPNAGGPPTVLPFGFLALPTNIGRYTEDQFSVVPEFGVTLGYQLGDHVRASLGYSVLYWYSTIRPGQAIDLGINPTQLLPPLGSGQLSGVARPTFSFNQSRDFMAQGISAGLEVRW